MKKTFYALGIFVLLLTGCNSSNRKCIENEFKGKLQAHEELVEIGTKKFRINTETKNRPVNKERSIKAKEIGIKRIKRNLL